MSSYTYHFVVSEIPDQTHYKYATSYEGSVRNHIFLRAEQLLRMVANLAPGEISLAIRFFYNPTRDGRPQDRMRIFIDVKAPKESTSSLIHQIIYNGPLAEFYNIQINKNPFNDWMLFQSVTEIIRFEEGIKPTNPPGLDIRKLNDLIPEIYYCVHPFEPREDNDFSMLDKTCSALIEPVLIEMMIQPTSQEKERESHYREIIKLMAINSYSKEEFILGADYQEPLKKLYEPKTYGVRETRAKDPIADDFLRIYRELHEILRYPQLLFNIKVWATNQEISHSVASTVAESAFRGGCYRLLSYSGHDRIFEPSLNASMNMDLFPDALRQDIWDTFREKGLSRLPHMVSVDEFKGLFRLPVAGESPFRCLWRSTDYHRKMDSTPNVPVILMGHRIEAITVKNQKPSYMLDEYLNTADLTRMPIVMPIDLLTKHMFIAGVPGSGKTTAVFNLLVQLFNQGVPFLVIEPGKTEYRQLKFLKDHPDPIISALSRELRIYTPGKDTISPFRLNPFQFPEGITNEEHIGQLLTCFQASMPLWGPLQALLAESLEGVYSEKMLRLKKDHSLLPNMVDLVDTARTTMAEKDYQGETKTNLSAAIDVRISSLTRLNMGRIFDCRQTMPSIQDLLAHPTIIEVQNLNPDQVCLLIMFLLTAVLEEIRISRPYGKKLKHVIIIEEAHNIVGRTEQSHQSSDFADPKAYAAEYIVRMLAEIRALGEGIIIADQLPSAVAASVVKNTGTKLAHRLVSLMDRQDLGGAMLLQGEQMEEIARLEPGQAYYYTEGLYAPLQIKGLDTQTFLGLNEKSPPNNDQLQKTVQEEEWSTVLKKGIYRERIQALSEFLKRMKQITHDLTVNLNHYHRVFYNLKEKSKKVDVSNNLVSLAGIIKTERKKLLNSFKQLIVMVSPLPGYKLELKDNDSDFQYNQIIESYDSINKEVVHLKDSLNNLGLDTKNLLRERQSA